MPPPKQPTFSSRRRMAHILQLGHEHSGRCSQARSRSARNLRRARKVGRRVRRSPTGGHAALAIIARLGADDLRNCAGRVATWHESGLATPLLVAEEEFDRSLDAFPFEFGAILAEHVVVSGIDPFAGLHVDPADLRRASEIQARSHLLHLREGYLETHGRSDAVADLIVRSAPSLAALVTSVARLHGIAADGAGSCRSGH